jgi:hypothetical protein
MVGVRYSARGPGAFAVRGLDIFLSGVSDICLRDIFLFAEFSENANNGRAYIDGCRFGRAERNTAAALSGNLNGMPLSLADQLCALSVGRAKLRRPPIGGDGAARTIRDVGCPTAVVENEGLWRQPPQTVRARVQDEPKLRQGGCP